ncbi:MAG: trehalase family glycosidase [Woeseiaceae bacterium]|nr:trehalase family glycosidase [Woeseiaceae bacterium]
MIDVEAARKVLRANDRGGHTVPTDGLYPFAWSWDSAITALGWLTFDEARAWDECHTMFSGQWDNGMVPHILFHGGNAESYFPGPDVWGSNTAIPSSAISQPPVWATAIRMMAERAQDRALAESALAKLMPQLIAYHDWWYNDRDRADTGLVRSYHPWESGMDNSPAWDTPLMRVPEVEWEYQRRDLGHVDQDQRPHKPEYDRYLYLVDFYKKNGFDSDIIYNECPYRVVDIGIVAILQRATKDLVVLCRQTGHHAAAERMEGEIDRTQSAIDKLWSPGHRCFFNYDLVADEPLEEVTTGTVLPLFGGLAGEQQAADMAKLLDEWIDASPFAVASTHPSSPRYEPQRYWRGPIWLHINWMLALGLRDYGYDDVADRVNGATRACVDASGFFEYFDAESGAGCGGGDFSWTAAVALYWLAD